MEREITEQEWKNHLTVKHSTHYVRVYIYFTKIPFYFHITSIHVPNGLVRTDEFLRLSLRRLWRHKFVQQQVELQVHSNEMLANQT